MSQVNITIDTDGEIDRIIQRLNTLPDRLQAPDMLRKAVNSAARKTRKRLIEEGKNRYAFKKKGQFASETKIKTAGVSSGAGADIISKGRMRMITDFVTRPNSATAAAAAKVLNESGMNSILRNGNKAFSLFLNGGANAAIAVRLGKPRLPIQVLMSPAVPVMLGQEEVREPATEDFFDNLSAEIEKQIAKILG